MELIIKIFVTLVCVDVYFEVESFFNRIKINKNES
jgi:hypothetical protein